MKTYRSLFAHLSIIVILAVALVFLLQGANQYLSQRTRILDEMHHQASESLERLAQTSASFMEAYAVNEYRKLVANEIELKNHYAIVVRDRAMGEIVGEQAYVSGRIRSPDGTLEDFTPENPTHLERIGNAYLEETTPVLSGTGTHLGSITVYLSDDALTRELQKVLRETLVSSTVLALLLIGLLVMALKHLFVRPLRRIAQALEDLDIDGLPVNALPGQDYREIAKLTDTMSHMIRVIRHSHTALSQQRTRLQHVIEGTQVGTWEWNVQTGEVVFNPRWAEIVGYSLEELQPLSINTWLELAHPDDLKRSGELLKRHFDGELPYYNAETRMRHKEGHWVWVLDRGRVSTWTETGQPLTMSGTHQDITEQKTQALLLAESETRFRSLFEKNSSVMLLIEPDSGRIIQANPAAANYYGYPVQQLEKMSIDMINSVPRDRLQAEPREALEVGKNRFHFRHRLASGETRDVEVYSTPIDHGSQGLLFSIVNDITDRVNAEQQLQLAASVFTHAREAIIITDSSARIIDTNASFTRITGYTREEALGQNPRLISSGLQDGAFYEKMWHSLIEKKHWYGELWNRRKNGEHFASLLTISAVSDGLDATRHYVALFSDITPFKENERELEHTAHHDALTGLPNRLLLGDRLRQAMIQETRRGQRLAVAFLDLDGFKQINDQYGHEIGDRLLIRLANQMRQTLRDSDTLARLGGDEFVAVLPDLVDNEQCRPLLNRLLQAVSTPMEIGEQTLRVSASLGVTLFPQVEDVDADQLLRQADQAMYQAKLAGKNRYHIFDTEQDRSQRGRHEELARIGQAIANRELVLFYQPKINMRSGKLVGVEALVRWQHPEYGLLPPGRFLPTIENHPLIVALGEWTLEQALEQAAAWNRQGLQLEVSVNIAAFHLQRKDFVARLRDTLERHSEVEPAQLQLEILETSALESVSHVSRVIEQCLQLGVSFALDDFGTGYSSLSYLKRLPAKVLKIDQSFVRDMRDDPEDLTILEGVISLAGAFHRQVIAEGVESAEHGQMLLWLGCELAQGYGIARPMAAAQLQPWLNTWKPPSPWRTASAINRDRLPILFAMVQHRAWISAVVGYLQGKQSSPPPLESKDCLFSRWLEHSSLSQTPVLSRIRPLHNKAHDIADELMRLKRPRERTAAAQRIDELHQVRDQLLDNLQQLIER